MNWNHNAYVTNLVSAARQNHKERTTVMQGEYMKVNVMCLPMYKCIGAEVHENEDQLITVVCGMATVKLGNTRCNLDCVRRLNPGDSILIPAGTWHDVCNTGSGHLRLISLYAYVEERDERRESCGCAQMAMSGSDNVFNAAGYRFSTDTQTQDGDCSCRNSGC